jgi:cellulose synthase/poly-beta-1,6-N-acetylglucosamine synthase-like glycosyltransferase
MKAILEIIQWIIFLFLFIQVFYLLFFSIAGKLGKKAKFPAAKKFRRIRIFIPGYKEDAVIINTAKEAVNQNYPKELFEVVVIADSFKQSTLQQLRSIPVKVVEVSFENSTKGKALQKAIEATVQDPADIVLIIDADNHMSQSFLHKVNDAFEAGYEVVQGHRTAKDPQTTFALLDACTEEINNHIFRRGHCAVGLPSALIGSGMAFNWDLFISLLQNIGDTSGEDKEIEFRIVRQRKKVAFLDGAYVYDEKVPGKEIFSKQRSRWLATQVEFFEKYFSEGWIQLLRGNVAFFNKVFQTYLLPRVMLMAVLFMWWLLTIFIFKTWLLESSLLLLALTIALLSGIPKAWYNKKLFYSFLQIPGALIGMIKAMLHIGIARQKFIHTPHGEIKS